jgi:hypothetical protein
MSESAQPSPEEMGVKMPKPEHHPQPHHRPQVSEHAPVDKSPERIAELAERAAKGVEIMDQMSPAFEAPKSPENAPTPLSQPNREAELRQSDAARVVTEMPSIMEGERAQQQARGSENEQSSLEAGMGESHQQGVEAMQNILEGVAKRAGVPEEQVPSVATALQESTAPQPKTEAEPNSPETLSEPKAPEITPSLDSTPAITEPTITTEPSIKTLGPNVTFDQVIRDGGVGKLRLVEVKMSGGRRAVELEDPETGERVTFNDSGNPEIQAAGLFKDVEKDELKSQAEAEAWLEKYLRNYEAEGGGPINDQVEQSLIATISTIPDHVERDRSGAIIGKIGLEEKESLILTARARIHYHNADYVSQYSMEGFGEAYGKIYPKEHKRIQETPGVMAAIDELTKNEGEYYRMDSTTAAIEKDRILGEIASDLRIPLIDTVTGDTDDRVKKAFELGSKTLNILGYSADAEGIKLKDGTYKTFKSAEENWQFMIDNWDDIDMTNSLTGQSARDMKRAMYFPIHLEKPDTSDVQRGRNGQLRKFTSLWVTSAQKWDYNPDNLVKKDKWGNDILVGKKTIPAPIFGAEDKIKDTLAAIQTDAAYQKYANWAARTSMAYKERTQFTGKGGESVLTVPIVDPNSVNNENFREKLPNALKNVKALGGTAYSHLEGNKKQAAMSAWVKACINYTNSKEARNNQNSLGWNNFVREKAILIAKEENIINDKSKMKLLGDMFSWANWRHWDAVFDDSGKEFMKGMGDGLKNLWNALKVAR